MHEPDGVKKEGDPSKQDSIDWQAVMRLMLFALAALAIFFAMSGGLPPYETIPASSKDRRTAAILQTLETGVALHLAKHGQVQTSFEGLCLALKDNPAFIELQELFAIRQEQACFVDGWQRPIRIVTDVRGGIVFISTGRDGVAGTKDDMRSDDDDVR